MAKRKLINIRISEEDHKILKLESVHRNTNMSSIIRQAVKVFLEKYSKREEKK